MNTHWPDNYRSLHAWWQTPKGQACLEFEKELLQQRLSRLFGYQLLLLADDTFASCASDSRILNYARIDPLIDANIGQTRIQLPENIDVVIIPHWIYYFPHLDPLLTALWQSLISGGLLIMTGYDTWRWLRLEWPLQKNEIAKPPRPFLQSRQMEKLLSQEQFVLNSVRKYRQPKTLTKLTMIEATKNIATVKTVKPRWQIKPTRLTQSVLSPSTTHHRHDY